MAAPRYPLSDYPLSEAQQGLWFAQRLAPENPSFNTAHALWMDGALDVDAFIHAANRAVAEAQSLALRFVDTADGPRQWLDPTAVPTLEVIDLREPGASAGASEEMAREMMRADRLTPLEPTRDRLACQRLFVLGAGDGNNTPRYVWYLRAHHLAADGYAMALIGERVSTLYAGEGASRPFAPLLPVLEEDADYQQAAKRERDAAYWNKAFADTPPPACLSGDAPTSVPADVDCWRRIAPSTPRFRHAFWALPTRLSSRGRTC